MNDDSASQADHGPESVNPAAPDTERSIEITRVGENHYRAVGANGATLEFGRGEGLLTPVELLLAALAGCSAIDVDTVTSRRTEPERFSVGASSNLISEDGATRLTDISLDFDLAFPDDEAGRAAAGMVERLVQLSHDKHCTVSRTVEHATPVQINSRVENVSRR
ncbi:OsmC family protein [Brevibacterium daeguense]|uniref:OsmC family protein n=1 Tax=Brevibacterium daeguense TaxID=909936 RepID=A0ABP8EJG5_9MICO|nr:OsmC family protein [Brevibacterium daeguense]